MTMNRLIPFGRWHPDADGVNAQILKVAKNVHPVAAGFAPFSQPVAVGSSVGSQVRGAVSLLDTSGNVLSMAGTETALYKLGTGDVWSDVTRTSGGAYAGVSPERWRFVEFGPNIIATNYIDNIQTYNMTSSTNFEDLGGSPPKARYLAVVRDFVVCGHTSADNKAVQWSNINDSADWTIGGSSLADVNSLPDGGPITGLIGGEVGYIFQRDGVTRMTFVPGSGAIFQFDKVEAGRGLFAPDSLVHSASEAFYVGVDGVYRMNLVSGLSQPVGVGKWRDFFVKDMRNGSQSLCMGALAPQKNLYMLAYVSESAVDDTTPDRIIVYDYAIDEAAYIDVTAYTLARWLTQGTDLDSMDSFGTLDGLPFSLDADYWKGGAPLVGIFQADNKLAYFTGSAMAAEFVTADGNDPRSRHLITGTRPHIDSTAVTVEIAARERDGDTVSFNSAESLETTGVAPAWASGNYIRARIRVPAASTWTLAKGIETDSVPAGVQ